MGCVICGDERVVTRAIRFWDPDDGWRVGRFCAGCLPDARRRPKPEDFAYDRRGEYVADLDEAIDVLYG